MPVPADNPQSPAKIALGDRLFHDEHFSADGKVSCATCHEKDKAFTDLRRVSRGHDGLPGTRNAPTVINWCIRNPLESEQLVDDRPWGFAEYLHGKTLQTGGTREQGWSAAAAVIGHHALQGQPLLRIDTRQH